MANTLNGVNIDRIADLTLSVLMSETYPISAFATDLSADAMDTGKTVTVQLPTQPATQDLNASITPADVTMSGVTVTLSNYKGVALGFTDLERTYTDIDLINKYIQPSVVSCVEDVMAAVWALVLNANYSQSVLKTAAQLDADAVADLAASLTTAKVPKASRSLVIKPTYFANLAKDNAIQAVYAKGDANTINDNRIDRIHNFNVIEYNGTIPANAEALEGMALHPSAVAIAARAPLAPPAGTWYGQVRNIKDPKTGLPLQIRLYYNDSKLVLQMGLNYGVAKGQPLALFRIRSA